MTARPTPDAPRERLARERDRLEQRRRRARGAAEQGYTLPPRLQEALASFDRGTGEISNRTDALMNAVEQRLTRGGWRAPSATGDTPSDTARPPSPLDRLSVAALHKIEQIDSLVRHSVVEACLYNLRILAELAAEQKKSVNAMEGFREVIEALPLVGEELRRTWDLVIEGDLRLGALFPVARDDATRHFDSLRCLCHRASAPPPQVVEAIDSLMNTLGLIGAEVRSRRLDLAEVARFVADLHRPQCERQGVTVRVVDRTDGQARIHGHRGGLVTALGECLRNALKHAFAVPSEGVSDNSGKRVAPAFQAVPNRLESLSHGPLVTCKIAWDGPEKRLAVVTVSDNGPGAPPELLARLGQRGASTKGSGEGLARVRSIVEVQHLGSVSSESPAGSGFQVRLSLPSRLI